MIVEIISTGTELLLGQITNTNAAFLARRLNELGFDVLYQSTVGDNRDRMAQVMKTALSRADIVITTGGLGPTQGDITKEVAAQILDRKLLLHNPSLDRIKCFFADRHIAMSHNNIRQAMIPEGAIVVENRRGTAPGVIIEAQDKTIIHLPGPPHEMEWMFDYSIVPYLVKRFGAQGTIVSRVLRVAGIGESALEEKIYEYVKNQTNPTIALLAKAGEIHLRLTAKAASKEDAAALIDGMERAIRERIAEFVFGIDDDTLEGIVGKILAEKNLTIALAESCTGGLVTSRITDVPGSSAYLKGSVVCYSNAVKIGVVGVPAQIIDTYGAVSKETALSLASGIREKIGSDLGVGVTGIAGPDGGTADKPVGLVYIAVDGPMGAEWERHNFAGQRPGIKQRTSQAALNLVRRYAQKIRRNNT